MPRRTIKTRHLPPPTQLIMDDSGDSIDSDWKQESDVSSDDGSSLQSVESNLGDSDSENIPLVVNKEKEQNQKICKKEQNVKKKRKPAPQPAPTPKWNPPSDLDELDVVSDLDILNAGPRKRKYNVESKIRGLHPEIGTVWRDLKQKSSDPKVDPNQPPDVSLKLLPFQLEGVSWLKHQEEGIFSGGILADEMVIYKTYYREWGRRFK